MNLSPAINLIAEFEGLHRVGSDGLVYAYTDMVGVRTIGFGITDPEIVRQGPYTPAQCRIHLLQHVIPLHGQIVALSPILAGDEARTAAILSFAYNLGAGAYRGSTLRRRVNEGDWERAASECMRWIYAGGRPVRGLVRRRAAEAQLLRGVQS